MKMRVIDCVSHDLTGPGMRYACGINHDGTAAKQNATGLPIMTCFIFPVGRSEAKLNSLRVEMTQAGKRHKYGRLFRVRNTTPIVTTTLIGSVYIRVELVVVFFDQNINMIFNSVNNQLDTNSLARSQS